MYDWQKCIPFSLLVYVKSVIQMDANFMQLKYILRLQFRLKYIWGVCLENSINHKSSINEVSE